MAKQLKNTLRIAAGNNAVGNSAVRNDARSIGRASTRSTGRATLNDVAIEAGVSPITVSRALRGTRAVAPDLILKVNAAVKKIGYVPDPAARALASQTSNTVAILVPLLSNTLFVDLIEAVQTTLMPAGYQTLIGITHYDPAQEQRLITSYMAYRPAGYLVTGFDRTPASRRMLSQSKAPTVHMMETARAKNLYSVGFSQSDAGAELTEHLLKRGRKRIVFVGAQLDDRAMQRLDGYRQALKKTRFYDAKFEVLDQRSSSIGLGAELFNQIIAKHPQVDAMFFCNDDLAHGGLLAALKRGIKVPEQIAIAGFNDLAGSSEMPPPLTTIRTRRSEIGEQSAELLLRLIRKIDVPDRSIDVGYELIIRQST